MILFVFEGGKREPAIFEELKKLFFPEDEVEIVCAFEADFHTLYKSLDQHGWELFPVLQERARARGDYSFDKYVRSDFGQIYLFFDYDFHNRTQTVEELDRQLTEMLSFFDNETEEGLMYVSYPMVEALFYTRQLPDPDYVNYEVAKASCKGFKKEAYGVCCFGGDPAWLHKKSSWLCLVKQNVEKAAFLCQGEAEFPVDKDIIFQRAIFDAQVKKYVVPRESVAILSAFPLFLYDYFPAERFVKESEA